MAEFTIGDWLVLGAIESGLEPEPDQIAWLAGMLPEPLHWDER